MKTGNRQRAYSTSLKTLPSLESVMKSVVEAVWDSRPYEKLDLIGNCLQEDSHPECGGFNAGPTGHEDANSR